MINIRKAGNKEIARPGPNNPKKRTAGEAKLSKLFFCLVLMSVLMGRF